MRGMRERGSPVWRRAALAGALALTAVLVGCATTPTGSPRVMQPGDFKMLAGTWTGSAYVQQAQPLAIQGVIQETGAFYIVPRGAPSGQIPGQMRIVDGGVVYESPHSKGTMTFHETATGWVWKWQGVTPDGSAVRNELTKAK
jgi:hypothetical protein